MKKSILAVFCLAIPLLSFSTNLNKASKITPFPSALLFGKTVNIHKGLITSNAPLQSNALADTGPWKSTEKITGAHDPSIIRDERGVYTLLTTNNLLEVRQSADMVTWTSKGRIFSALPAWMKTINSEIVDIWAPHIIFRDGRYWVYYSGSSFGSNNSVIGVVSSPTLDTESPDYKWTDHGEVIRSVTSNDYNAIDAEILTDLDGRVWMSFGSFWSGIKMIEIDPATGKRIAASSVIYNVASRGGGAIEGPSTIEHNGYYYMFTSWDKCCSGLTSTYRTMVGRSESPNSGYVDKQNRSINNNYSQELLKSYGRYIGPGGGSPFKDGRRDYYVLHYYNGNQNGSPTLQIREIVWDETDWPILAQPFLGRRLSYEAEHAILTNAAIATNTNASNTEYVTDMSAAGSKITFHINAFAAGEYTLRVRYAAADGNASHFLKVNNGTSSEVLYPATSSSGSFPEGQVILIKVNLKESGNVLEFSKGVGVAEIDRVCLIRDAISKIQAGATDNGVGYFYSATGNNSTMPENSWTMYENIDFGNGGFKDLVVGLSSASDCQIKLSIDDRNGATSSTFTLNSTENNLSLPAQITEITGIHDVYMTMVSGTAELDFFQFSTGGGNTIVDCNNTPDGTAAIDACGNCAGGTTGMVECTSVAEVEDDACSYDGIKESTNSGFKGTGYINGTNAIDGSIRFSIDAAESGKYDISLRYSNGTATGRSAKVLVNGVVGDDITFPSTTSFSQWANLILSLTLEKGINRIDFLALNAEGLPNLDQIGYISPGIFKGVCEVTAIDEVNYTSKIKVFPNPFTNGFFVYSKNDFSYSIVNTLGMEVERGRGNNRSQLGTELPAGLYLMVIRDENGYTSLKIKKD